MSKKKSTWKFDLPAGLVVFLVALPLCLGVGAASTNVEGITGMPNIFSGVIAGIIGGIVVGFTSGSRIGVSGPAAGLITIILGAIATLGSFEAFLVAVIICGIIQLIAGFLKLGIIGHYFPSSVIKGMLASIGIILIFKQIPHAFGYDKDFFGDEAFFQFDGHNTFSELLYASEALHPGAITIAVLSILILILFERPFMKKIALFKIIPGPLIVVAAGIILNIAFGAYFPDWAIKAEHLVKLPTPDSPLGIIEFLSFPDFSILTNPNVYIVGGTLAIVGSLETLLSVEATDKLDPEKHHTPTNRELKAQGIGNIVSGLVGGLPITQVIVRSTANVSAGGKSKISTITHGVLLVVSVMFLPTILNLIPLSALAGILIMIGYKLAKVKLFKETFKLGRSQFIPFIATIVGVLATDLLKGIGIGLFFAFYFILKRNFQNNYTIHEDDNHDVKILLSEEVTFLNKASILERLEEIPENTSVVIDGTNCTFIHYDVLEIIQEYRDFGAPEKNIRLKTINIKNVEDSKND